MSSLQLLAKNLMGTVPENIHTFPMGGIFLRLLFVTEILQRPPQIKGLEFPGGGKV